MSIAQSQLIGTYPTRTPSRVVGKEQQTEAEHVAEDERMDQEDEQQKKGYFGKMIRNP